MYRALALAVLLAVPGAVRADDPVNLKWTLKEGDTFYGKTTVVQGQTVSVLGMDVEFTMEIGSVLKYEVTAAKQGTTTVKATYLASTVEAKGLPFPVEEMGKKAKGAVITLTIDEKGAVTKVEGAEKIADKFKDAKAIEKELGGAMFSEAAVREMVGLPFTVSPEKPVKAGDTWVRDEKTAAAGFDVSGKTTYKVDSVEQGVAKVTTKSDLTIKAGAGGAAGLPFKISKIDVKTDKAGGGYTFDVKAGRLKDYSQELTMSGDITATVDGNDLKIGMKTKQTMKVAISDKSPSID